MAEFHLSDTDIVCVQRVEVGGQDALDIRLWTKATYGDYLCTERGFSIRTQRLPDLLAVIQEAFLAGRAEV
ncbi:MAG: hypothetical protein AAGK37_08625 [Pseudomonadota bacterium]